MKTISHLWLALLLSLTAGTFACQPPQSTTETPHAPDAWTLDATTSTITLFVVKADRIGETFLLQSTRGTVTATGKAQITFSLGSLETGIPIRNERIQTHLLDTNKWPTATASGDINLEQFDSLPIGQSVYIANDIMLEMQGISITYTVDFMITRLGNARILVQSAKPVSFATKDYQFGPGLTTLQELAGLPSITPVVGVNFSLVFDGQ